MVEFLKGFASPFIAVFNKIIKEFSTITIFDVGQILGAVALGSIPLWIYLFIRRHYYDL